MTQVWITCSLWLSQGQMMRMVTHLFFEYDVLMRVWRDKNSSNFDDAEVIKIVAPKPIRSQLLRIAHDIPASGHLGIAQTKSRLEKHFYWTTITKDVRQYVLFCDICQRLGKGSKLPIACLHPLPVMDDHLNESLEISLVHVQYASTREIGLY